MKTSDKVRFNAVLVLILTLQILIGMLASPEAGFSADVKLEWDPSTDADVAGYKIYYQSNSSTLPLNGTGAAEGGAPVDVANTVAATINGIDPDVTYYFAVTAYNSAGVESPYSNILEVKESVPPVVTLTSPSSNASVRDTVAVSAAASDNVGVTSVQFFVNDALQATTTATPYVFNWNTSTLPNGRYTVSAKAFDAAGNVGQSETLTLVVGTEDTTPPTVSLSASGNSTTVSGNVTVTAAANDNIGVVRIELYDDSTLVLASNEGSVSYNWNSTLSSNGLHILIAKAYDAAGNVGVSANVAVNVFNDTTAPVISIASPVNNGTAGGSVVVSANASDNVAVTKVEFFVNGSLQATLTSAPYSFNWNTAALANGAYTLTSKAFDAAGNVGQSANVAVNVLNDTTAPAVIFLAPTSSYVYGSSIAVGASATDNVAVTKMELYIDNVLKYTTTNSSFNTGFSFPVGIHTLMVKAYDAANNVKAVTKSVNRFY